MQTALQALSLEALVALINEYFSSCKCGHCRHVGWLAADKLFFDKRTRLVVCKRCG